MKRFRFKDHIVFENENFLAINKPAGVSSLHERLGEANSVLEEAKKVDEKLQLCHRLDKDTSGVLLLSKHSAAYRHAAMAFEKRKVRKTYHAICDGAHDFSQFEIDLTLITTRSGRAAVNKQKGKPSKTILQTLEIFGHHTLVSCEPVSGRQHQIRIHLASQGASLVADTIYGGQFPYLSRYKKNFSLSKQEEERPMLQRFALHAYSLELQDMDESDLQIVAPYPKDLAVFLKQLNKYDSLR